ncbi:unnamed protein product, partial [Diplocarpon coronariae]
ARIHFEKYA